MNKIILQAFLGLVLLMLTSFKVHKFYVSIYQIHAAPEKEMLQITSRIFMDDLNAVLYRNYHKKTHLGEKNESPEDVVLMKKYILEHFAIKVNGMPKTIHYLSKDYEGNVIICYYRVNEVSAIKTLEVSNTVLMDLNAEQQNIIQTTIAGKKQNLLLTEGNTKGILK